MAPTPPASSPHRPHPLRGYLLINLVVWVVCGLIFYSVSAGWFSTVAPAVQRPAAGGVLLLVMLSFLLASVYDFVFDRYRPRLQEKQREGAETQTAPADRTPRPESQ